MATTGLSNKTSNNWLNGIALVFSGTAGFGGSDIYFRKILSQVKQFIDASNVIVGEYMCQGRMPQSVRERYLKMKKAPDHPQNLDVLIQNFDCALSHSDANDLEKLKEAVINSSF